MTIVIIIVSILLVWAISDSIQRRKDKPRVMEKILRDVEVESELDRAEDALKEKNLRLSYYICNKILEQRPHWRAHFIRGMTSLEEGSLDEALDDLKSSIKLNPDKKQNRGAYELARVIQEGKWSDESEYE